MQPQQLQQWFCLTYSKKNLSELVQLEQQPGHVGDGPRRQELEAVERADKGVRELGWIW